MSADTQTPRRGRGPNDPGRRDRIARAAVAVVARRGVDGVTHRAVAAEAGVPLGSTTYHFATLDDLLAEALRTAIEQNTARLQQWERSLAPDVDFAAALADLVMGEVTVDREQSTVEYELYVAALHHPLLRPASSEWDAVLTDLFASRTDPLTGRLLAATVCGLELQALLADPPPTRDEVEELFRRVVSCVGER